MLATTNLAQNVILWVGIACVGLLMLILAWGGV